MKWMPVVYRGNGAWIGVMSSGKIGVGVEEEGRATLEGSNFVPMWPFMEKGMREFRSEFEDKWHLLKSGEIPTVDDLIYKTIASAWRSGREYWMKMASICVAESSSQMRANLESLRLEMIGSSVVEDDVRDRLIN